MVIQGEHSEIVNNFIYLGSSISNVSKDIKKRIDLALSSFGRIRKSIWSNKNIVLKLKIRLYRSSHPEVFLEKRCSENMQQIYRRTPVPKCDFNKVALQLYSNHTSAWVFSCKFAAYFQKTPFLKNTSGRLFLFLAN